MRSLLTIIYGGLVVTLLLWPYTFSIPCTNCPNGATWVADAGQVQFRTPGLVRSISPPTELAQTLNSGNGLTIETWLTPYVLRSTGFGRIVSYSQDFHRTNFTLGQYQNALIFRLRADADANNRQIFVPRVFTPEQRQHIVISYDFSHCRVYVDGELRQDLQTLNSDFSTWNPDYLFMLANEGTGDRPWLGSIENVVLYNRPVTAAEVTKHYDQGSIDSGLSGVVASFDFSQGTGSVFDDTSRVEPFIQLELPPTFINQKNVFLSFIQREESDFSNNFLLFVPFGVLLAFTLLKQFPPTTQTLVATVCITVLFAFTIESLQFFLENRTSSFFDLISCIAGSLTGSFVGLCINRLFALLRRYRT